MAFIKCPECGRRFSETEHACPCCGYLMESQQPPQQETQSNDQVQQNCDHQRLNIQQVSSEQNVATQPDHQQEIEGQQQPDCQPLQNSSPQPNFQSQSGSQQERQQYIKCPECGKTINGTEQACPNCGYPLDDLQPQSETQIKKDPVNDDTPIDWSKVFFIRENKFKETKFIAPLSHHPCGKTSLDPICDDVGAIHPFITIWYREVEGIANISLYYSETDLLEHLDADDSTLYEELKNDIDSPCIGLIITFDGKEDLKVQCSESDRGDSFFHIDQDLMLKCCNAQTIDFEIFKENNETVYIAHETAADKETGDREDRLILSFRAMYNYIVDPNMFPDAPRKWQLLNETLDKKQKEAEEKEITENNLKGRGWIVAGIISLIVGPIMFFAGLSSESPGVMTVGLFLFTGGWCPLLVGIGKKNGRRNKEIWDAIIEHLPG